MRMRAVSFLFLISVALTACSAWQSSRVNPSNWFGNSRAVSPAEAAEATVPQAVNPLIPQTNRFARPAPVYSGVLIDQITDLRVEQTTEGAIIIADGLAARQGAYEARLIPIDPGSPVDANGRLAYRFEVLYPDFATPIGPDATRRVAVARSVSIQDLAPVRVIRIDAARNTRESRRN